MKCHLAQSADYAQKLNNPSAYYTVFNIKENSVLRILGDILGSNIVKTSVRGVNIYSIVCDLRIKLPSSEAAKLEQIDVSIPT